MHARTNDGHNAMTIARWPLASGAKKEKMLITSNCSFSHSVLYLLVSFLPFSLILKSSSAKLLVLKSLQLWFGKKLILYHTIPIFNNLEEGCPGTITLNFDQFNPFPNKPLFLRVNSTSLLKTLLKREKLLIASNFSFSQSVFYPFYPF